eukprot:6492301-Amphidinium_carterae.1
MRGVCLVKRYTLPHRPAPPTEPLGTGTSNLAMVIKIPFCLVRPFLPGLIQGVRCLAVPGLCPELTTLWEWPYEGIALRKAELRAWHPHPFLRLTTKDVHEHSIVRPGQSGFGSHLSNAWQQGPRNYKVVSPRGRAARLMAGRISWAQDTTVGMALKP